MSKVTNVAANFLHTAKLYPEKIALCFKDRNISFSELEDRIISMVSVLDSHGVKQGEKVLMFVKPGEHFACVTFALFYLGAVPVFIDPGMGKKNMLNAVSQVRASYLIGHPVVSLFAAFYSHVFANLKNVFCLGNGLGINLLDHSLLKNKPEMYLPRPNDLTSILFTSGATGPAKGVEYTHEIFNRQTSWLKELFCLNEYDVDVAGFPLFSLFTLSMGMCSVTADLDVKNPGSCKPEKLVAQIQKHQATFLAGSPAIWQRVVDHCLKHNIILPSVRSLVMFGAPVSPSLHLAYKKILPNGSTYTPYGATEALPISCISSKELLCDKHPLYQFTAQGHGTCVGHVVPGVNLLIIESKKELSSLDLLKPQPVGVIGEILVSGEVVTKRYHELPDATKSAKIYDQDGVLWHRMGDAGYLDKSGLLWYCGRVSHQVIQGKQALHSDPVEGIFNAHPFVSQSALIATEDGAGVVIIPKNPPQSLTERTALAHALANHGKNHELVKHIAHFFISNRFPVDRRHNIKIDRIKLTNLAKQGQLKRISQ